MNPIKVNISNMISENKIAVLSHIDKYGKIVGSISNNSFGLEIKKVDFIVKKINFYERCALVEFVNDLKLMTDDCELKFNGFRNSKNVVELSHFTLSLK